MKPYILLLTLILGAGPWFPESGRAQSSLDPVIAQMISNVADSTMLQTIAGLQNFETRYSMASTRDTVARWIKGRFLAAGITDVVLDGFTYAGVELANVVATIHGTSSSAGEFVVGAHYDSYSQTPYQSAPGADDDGSGTSAVIEMARVLSANGYVPASTMRFVCFSGEEQGLRGSYVYAQRARNAGRPIRAMLNFDQIGYRNVGDPQVYLVWYEGGEALATLGTEVMRLFTTLTPLFITEPRARSDSYSFASLGYPAVWWLEYGGLPFYHTTYDRVEFVDGAYAAEIARSALALMLTLDKSTVDVHPVSETLPTTPRLYPNYPNPFNPSTTIKYDLPRASVVRLNVYDVLGREVSVLVNDRREAGLHEVKFSAKGGSAYGGDGSDLASGVYFYQLHAGTFVETRKLVLIR